MNLHHDKDAFEELLIGAANELAIPTNIIEKDYYVTIALKSLSEKLNDMVFKGGTSLTKCYQLLDRFSEDIDISYTVILSILVDTFISKISLPMQPVPEIGSISVA